MGLGQGGPGEVASRSFQGHRALAAPYLALLRAASAQRGPEGRASCSPLTLNQGFPSSCVHSSRLGPDHVTLGPGGLETQQNMICSLSAERVLPGDWCLILFQGHKAGIGWLASFKQGPVGPGIAREAGTDGLTDRRGLSPAGPLPSHDGVPLRPAPAWEPSAPPLAESALRGAGQEPPSPPECGAQLGRQQPLHVGIWGAGERTLVPLQPGEPPATILGPGAESCPTSHLGEAPEVRKNAALAGKLGLAQWGSGLNTVVAMVSRSF